MSDRDREEGRRVVHGVLIGVVIGAALWAAGGLIWWLMR